MKTMLKKMPKWLPAFTLYMVLVIAWHIIMKEDSGDFLTFRTYWAEARAEGHGIIYILIGRYYSWTSRMLVELVLIPLSWHIGVFKVLNVMAYALGGYCMLRLTHFRNYGLTLALMLMYPIEKFSSAGWMANYLNYFWPLVAGLVALVAIDMIHHEKRISVLGGGYLRTCDALFN